MEKVRSWSRILGIESSGRGISVQRLLAAFKILAPLSLDAFGLKIVHSWRFGRHWFSAAKAGAVHS
jgi:hypothetical protein